MPQKPPIDSVFRGLALPAGLLAVLLALLPIGAGCGSTPKTQRLPPQTMSPTPAPETQSLAEPETAPPTESAALDPREPIAAPAEAAPSRPVRDTSALTVVIEEVSGESQRRRTLVEAAAAERERRKTSGKQIAVITNENLKDYAQGQLTEIGPEPAGSATTAGPEAEGPPAIETEESEDPETYWRNRVRRARTEWAAAVDEIDHLQNRIAELRQRFYAEEDPYYRDSRIKPSWDRALDRLEEARAAAERHRMEVQTILEEGRRAAALPGWLREGLDLEPDLEDSPEGEGVIRPGEYEPGEPQLAPDPDGSRP